MSGTLTPEATGPACRRPRLRRRPPLFALVSLRSTSGLLIALGALVGVVLTGAVVLALSGGDREVTLRDLARDLDEHVGEDVTVRGQVTARGEEALVLRAGFGDRVLVVAGPTAAALPDVRAGEHVKVSGAVEEYGRTGYRELFEPDLDVLVDDEDKRVPVILAREVRISPDG